MTATDENVTLNDAEKAELTAKVMEESIDGAPKGLKILVIVMGVMILAMIALIIGTIAYRASVGVVKIDERVEADAPQPTQAHSVPSMPSMGKLKKIIEVVRPKASVFIKSELSGSTLLLQFKSDSGADIIKLLDLVSGMEKSQVVISP